MLRKLMYSLPDLKQSWLILLLFAGGQFAAAMLQLVIFNVFVGYDFGSGELSDNEKYQAFETSSFRSMTASVWTGPVSEGWGCGHSSRS